MAEFTLSLAQRDGLRDALRDYCAIISNWSWNSSTLSFLLISLAKTRPVYYNAGIEEAIRTHLAPNSYPEEMILKKIL